MNHQLQTGLRRVSRQGRRLALRRAGTTRSGTAVIRHVGRKTGTAFRTPITVVPHGDEFLVALPYGERTDWLRNVLASGTATIELRGTDYPVDEPEVVRLPDVLREFPPAEQRMLRLFRVESALRLHRA